MLVLQHFTLLIKLFASTYFLTLDHVITSYSTHLYVNWYLIYLSLVEIGTLSTETIQSAGSLLVSHYLFDTFLYFVNFHHQNKNTFIAHHLAAIILIILHLWSVLPVTVGITYIMLFEYSNTFLLLFQLCNEKGWYPTRNLEVGPKLF